jgi:hypothetical protein
VYLTVYAVTADGRMKSWTGSSGEGHATFHGNYNQKYWFWVTAKTSLGWSDAAGSPVIQTPPRNHGQPNT